MIHSTSRNGTTENLVTVFVPHIDAITPVRDHEAPVERGTCMVRSKDVDRMLDEGLPRRVTAE